MNLADLSVLLAAVELAVKRGTFSVLEIGAVGEAATKLGTFLADAKAQADAAKEAEAAAEEGQEAEAAQTEGSDEQPAA